MDQMSLDQLSLDLMSFGSKVLDELSIWIISIDTFYIYLLVILQIIINFLILYIFFFQNGKRLIMI